MPENVEKVELDAISGQRSHSNFPSRFDYVIKGTLSNEPDSVHKLLKVCRGEENKLATEARISSGDYNEKEFIFLNESDPVSEDGRNRWQEGISAWIASQSDPRYSVPTEYCGSESDISVDISQPKDKEKFDSEEITYKIKAGSDAGIAKVEFYVNGELKKTVENQREFEDKITLKRGKYELRAKAYSRSGSTKESSVIKIGTGGMEWDYVEPTATPTPTPTPTVSIIPTGTATPTGTIPPITP